MDSKSYNYEKDIKEYDYGLSIKYVSARLCAGILQYTACVVITVLGIIVILAMVRDLFF